MDTLKLFDRHASHILTDLRHDGKIIMHESSISVSPSTNKPHHGGPATYYTKA